MFETCRRSIPPGSVSRLNRLLRGKCAIGWACWPNGASKNAEMPPKRVYFKVSTQRPTQHTECQDDVSDCSEYDDSFEALPVEDAGPAQSAEVSLTQELAALLDEVEADINWSGECSGFD